MTISLTQKANQLSTKPGVYQMLNAKGTIIYVGKARNLKKRVKSYFRKNLDSAKTQALMSQVANFEVIITESENEALLLESNLIKKYRPRYNVLLRDDKSYPYLYLSTHQKFPRLDFYRGAKSLPGRYFGPYPNAGSVRENLAIIQKLFKLRQCSDSFFNARSRPCLQYQIKRCTAPCVDYVSEQDYQQQVKHAILFLEGKNSTIIEDLTNKMEKASEEMHYEDAAYYRDLIIRFRKLTSKQYITSDEGDIDILGVAEQANHIAIAVLFIRGGRLIGHRTFFPNVPIGTDKESALSEFIPQFYLSPMRGEKLVKQIVIGESLSDRLWIQNALKEKLDQTFIIKQGRVEKFKRWLSLANTNAEFALAQQISNKNNIANKLAALQSELKLPNPVNRIECFDVSHTKGEAAVASCVVFTEEGASKKDYRQFNIKNITPGDDYAALYQALMRHYTHLKESGSTLPDLLMIDGGKGQCRQAAKVLEELQVSGVIIMGVAKGAGRKPGLEKLFIFGKKEPIHLAMNSIALHLIQFVRDEAHRFAITAHRAKRAKKRMQSPLENIEGIGAKRRRELLRYFGGLQECQKASVLELSKVPGISQKMAKKIYDALH